MQDRVLSYVGNDYGVRDVHNHLLPFLAELDNHCRKYQITYSLAFGSILGCIRNNGFIPWDDDVDIMMKRLDYERFFVTLSRKETEFSKICRVESPRHLFKLCDKTSSSFPIFIDIYPVDNVPNGWLSRYVKLLSVQALKNIIIGRRGKKNNIFRKFRRYCAYAVSFPFSVNSLVFCYQKVCQWGNNSLTSKISCYSTGWGDMGKYYPFNMLDNIVYSKFEDLKLPVVADYHTYLTIEFGADYMTPPSENKRIPTHLNINK